MKRVIGFTKPRAITYVFSIVVLAGLFVATFLRGGFNLGIDFQPGVSVQVGIDPSRTAAIGDVRSALASMESVQVQAMGDAAQQDYTIRVRAFEDVEGYTETVEREIKSLLSTEFGAANVKVGIGDDLSTISVGPRYSESLTNQAFLLVGLALVLILIYVWIRFKLGYAIAAIAATLHDTVWIIGFIGAVQMEITSTTIAAVLTIIGYSLNDTIVVFDRIRENEKVMADQKLGFIYDSAITQTLSRTIATGLTTILAVAAIVIFAHGEIQDFAETMIAGVIVGTFSSIYIASPLLLDFRNAQMRRRKIRDAKLEGRPRESIEASLEGEQSISNASDVDADAVAEDIRRMRQDKKKF